MNSGPAAQGLLGSFECHRSRRAAEALPSFGTPLVAARVQLLLPPLTPSADLAPTMIAS